MAARTVAGRPEPQASVFLSAGPRIFDVTADGKSESVGHAPARPRGRPSCTPGPAPATQVKAGGPHHKLVSMTPPASVGENTLIPEVDATSGEVTLLDRHEQPFGDPSFGS